MTLKSWKEEDVTTFGLIYPNQFSIMQSSYTIRFLYNFINSFNNVFCDRIHLPERVKFPAIEDLKPINCVKSLESGLLPNQFDILGFSIHFENDFRNILWILEKAKIPLVSTERMNFNQIEKDNYPLIIAGGPVMTSNPLPFSKILDIIFIGDAEPNIGNFLSLYDKYKRNKSELHEFLTKCSKIEGIYVPLLKNKVKRAILKNIDESNIPNNQFFEQKTNKEDILGSNFFIEINRGCPYSCKFCISSFHNRPFRNRSFENLTFYIEESVKNAKFEKFSLIGSCVSSHPNFHKICETIISKGKYFSVPSMRLDHITPKLIKVFEKGGIKTITIAPEAGNEKLRYSLGKKFSNELLYQVVKQIKKSNIRNIKFYFLIGLPEESLTDVSDIIVLLKKINEIGFNKHSLKVNVNPFIPKFNTPYEKKCTNYLRKNMPLLKEKFQILEKGLKNIPSIKLKFKNFSTLIKQAQLQALISLGDHQISDLLINYYKNGANMGSLRRAEKENNISIDEYLKKVNLGYKPWII
ncbi:MAG: B12-binding domain-containing radical SAM protein [Promethearchaeota archaeon]